MKLNYLEEFVDQNIDIGSLRPNKSYDYLVQNRNATFNKIINDKETLKKYLKNRNCPGCNSDEYSLELNKDNLDIVKCKNCDLIYVNPVFDSDKYYSFYKSDSYQEMIKKLHEDSHNYRRQRFGKERMDVIEKFHNYKLDKTLLEIGCTTGFVLEEAIERGWDVKGVELNPSAVKFARERGIDVYDQPLEDIDFNEKFSNAALYDVLEHLLSPAEIIKKIYELLHDEGNIFIYVPNWNSASRSVLGEQNAHFIWPTHHLTYFTPLTLKSFLERYGFEVLHWETQGLDVYDSIWYYNEKTNEDTALLEKMSEKLQFYINAAGHGKNLRMYAKKVKK